MRTIRVSINKELKIVQFWCSSADTEKETFNEDIQTLFNAYASEDKKYRKVIYRSGSRDLKSLTAELLNHNVGLTA